ILYETAAGFSDALTQGEVASVVIRQGILALGAIAGGVHLVEGGENRLRLLSADGYPARVTDAYLNLPLERDTALARSARSGTAVYLESMEQIVREDPGSVETARQAGEEAFVALPVNVEGRTVAVLSLSFGSARTFPPEEREFHATLAQQTGQALE